MTPQTKSKPDAGRISLLCTMFDMSVSIAAQGADDEDQRLVAAAVLAALEVTAAKFILKLATRTIDGVDPREFAVETAGNCGEHILRSINRFFDDGHFEVAKKISDAEARGDLAAAAAFASARREQQAANETDADTVQ